VEEIGGPNQRAWPKTGGWCGAGSTSVRAGRGRHVGGDMQVGVGAGERAQWATMSMVGGDMQVGVGACERAQWATTSMVGGGRGQVWECGRI
jgi:hypothetical protein